MDDKDKKIAGDVLLRGQERAEEGRRSKKTKEGKRGEIGEDKEGEKRNMEFVMRMQVDGTVSYFFRSSEEIIEVGEMDLRGLKIWKCLLEKCKANIEMTIVQKEIEKNGK